MIIRKHSIVLAVTLWLTSPAFAQVTPYVPPHSNDPHPPANQPSYQLQPSPLSRPGVPGYPGAAHSNDPHFRQTEARPTWPPAAVGPGPWNQSALRRATSVPYRSSSHVVRPITVQERRKLDDAIARCLAKGDRNRGPVRRGSSSADAC